MAQVDLHVHSKYSNHPSEWFLQRLGAAESYTEPEAIYRLARSRGMDLVTITDHNRIDASLELVEKHPQHCFTGVEATAYFPEDGCKVHILIYGLNRGQFERIQQLRLNIYQLRDYLKAEDLACAVAHATYSVNGKLTLDHLEKLILLFNHFEGRNGSRSTLHNDVLSRVLAGLTPADIMLLQTKHGLKTWGKTPWRKTLCGGSDDHAGIFIGKTCSSAPAQTPAEFLRQFKQGRVHPEGRQNDFQGLTFAIYKIAYDFSQHNSTPFAQSTLSDLTRYLFSDQKLSLKDRIRLNKMKKQKDNDIYQSIVQLIEASRDLDQHDVDSRLDLVYDCIAEVSDRYFRGLLESLTTDLEEMDIIRIIQGLSSTIPGVFLSVPFFSSFRHMFGDRELINSLDRSLGKEDQSRPKRILWLTDTLTDLNGVSMTLQTIGRLAEEKGYDIRLMASLSEDQISADLPRSTLLVPPIHSFHLPHYEQLQINVPSLLRTLKLVYEYNPDEVYISTPGPLGLLGQLVGKLLGTKVTGIYHTDFTKEAEAIVAEPVICQLVEDYSKWFFNQFDRLLVPSSEYMQLLKERGYRHRHMSRFRRGLRTEHFQPKKNADRLHGNQPARLLYVGRVSRDKNLAFLERCYRQLIETHPSATLTIVGDGPYLSEMQQQCHDLPGLTFAGRVAYGKLPALYNAHDLLLFPSVTDTFGMAVLEAQACGLPALVANIGGPKEIVQTGQTGYVLPVADPSPWVKKLDGLLRDLIEGGEEYSALSKAARQRVEMHFCWDAILHEMVKPDSLEKVDRPRPRHKSSFQRLLKLASNMMVS